VNRHVRLVTMTLVMPVLAAVFAVRFWFNASGECLRHELAVWRGRE
jgi:hypothetical protein